MRTRFFIKHQKAITRGFIALVVLVCLTLHGFMLKEVHYTITSPKLTGQDSFTIALITDLHGCYYGQNQKTLVDLLVKNKPNVILLGGDIYDDKIAFTHTDVLLAQLSDIAPTYYVDGNHENWLPSAQYQAVLDKVQQHGITIIHGKQVPITNTNIHLYGVSDPASGGFDKDLQTVGKLAQPQYLNVLLSHRPERIEDYRAYPFDLVMSGHAHGGQWRLPFLLNGVFAPNQGLFPKYAGGWYQFFDRGQTTHLIVSRGLARESTRLPRFFNRPELVFVDINKR